MEGFFHFSIHPFNSIVTTQINDSSNQPYLKSVQDVPYCSWSTQSAAAGSYSYYKTHPRWIPVLAGLPREYQCHGFLHMRRSLVPLRSLCRSAGGASFAFDRWGMWYLCDKKDSVEILSNLFFIKIMNHPKVCFLFKIGSHYCF